MFDLLLKGGSVIDGSGAPRVRADVALAGDRIAAMEREIPSSSAAKTLAIDGLTLAPGFIDVHNHSEGWLLKKPVFLPKVAQGFTTEVLMSDGISYAPLTSENASDWIIYLRSLNALQLSDYSGWRSLDEYMTLLDRRTAQNSLTLVPYANVRVLAGGWGNAPADDTQMKIIRREIVRGMEAGAAGVSTGLDYVAQCFSQTDEIAEACQAMSRFGGLYVTHVRYKKGLMEGMKEAVDIARRAGVPLHVSHLKPVGGVRIEELLEYIDKVACQEVDFSFDVYPYMPGSTAINSLLPYEAWLDGPTGVAARLREPSVRRLFAELLADYYLNLDEIHLAWTASKDNSIYQGRTLADYIRGVGKSASEALADLLIEEQLAALAVFHTGDDQLVEPMLAHPKMMMGSDGIYHEGGAVHPRVYGSAPRMLGPLVRERKVFTLEQAVHKMTGYPARRFGMKERGEIRKGYFADLVAFNAETVRDPATFEKPHQLPIGIEHVLVNGIPVITQGRAMPDGQPGEMPGRYLRFGR